MIAEFELPPLLSVYVVVSEIDPPGAIEFCNCAAVQAAAGMMPPCGSPFSRCGVHGPHQYSSLPPLTFIRAGVSYVKPALLVEIPVNVPCPFGICSTIASM